MDCMQVMLYLLLTANVIPVTIANHLSGSCVAAGHHGCCIGVSNCRVGSCYCNQQCYRYNDCCNDIQQIGCYRHGTSFGTTQLLSSTVMLRTSQLLTTSTTVTFTSQLTSMISPPTTPPITPSLIRLTSSTPQHDTLSVSGAQDSSITTTTSHVVITRLGLPPQSVPHSNTVNTYTSSVLVTLTSSASLELITNSVTPTFLPTSASIIAAVTNNLKTHTKDSTSTNDQALRTMKSSIAFFQSSDTSEKSLHPLTSTWMIQPSVTPAIGATQEALSLPWTILAATLPLTMVTIAVLVIVLVWCFVIRKRAESRTTDFSGITNQPSATNLHELSYVQNRTSQSMEHIYSVPQHSKREACSSMIYNQAYKDSFALTINAAYTPTMKRSE